MAEVSIRILIMRKGEIYLIENKINGHKYVGKTLMGYKNRFKLHIVESKKFNERPLYRAFNKYGIKNFKVKVLQTCNADVLDNREIYWIDFFDTFNDHQHYNCTRGGDGGEVIQEVKDRISETMKKLPRGEKWEKSMSDSLKAKYDRGERWGFMNGKYDSTSHSKRKVKAIPDPEHHFVYGYEPISFEDQELIFDSITEAAIGVGGKTSNISRALKEGWVAYGYKWEKLDETTWSKKVYGIHKETGERTVTFPSIRAAARNWGKKDSGLRNALEKPGVKSFMKHYWFYDKEEL